MDELFPAEQAPIVQLLVELVDVQMHGVKVRVRTLPLGQAAAAQDRSTAKACRGTFPLHSASG